jgi:predicted DNA-binding transcriptional regulator YafY
LRGDFLGELHHSLTWGHHATIAGGHPQTDGSVTMELRFESLEAARSRLMGFGRGVEVLDPRSCARPVGPAEQVGAM